MSCTEKTLHIYSISLILCQDKKMKINSSIFTSSWEDLQGLSPPRKSALSVWRWQLMECRSLPWRLANSWQIVVLPQLKIKLKYARLANSWKTVVLPQLKNTTQICATGQLQTDHCLTTATDKTQLCLSWIS